MKDTSSKQQTKQKYKPNHHQTGVPPPSFLLIRGKTNKQKLSTGLTLYEAYTNHWINLRRAETNRQKEFNPEAWKKDTSNTISLGKKKNEKAENTTQMKEQTRNTEVQINEEEIGKLEKEFRIVMVKMIKNLENRMEKMRERIN